MSTKSLCAGNELTSTYPFWAGPAVGKGTIITASNEGKVMFLHVSVILFTGVPVRAETPWIDTPPTWTETSRQRPPLDIDPRTGTPRTVTSARYASYWNTFLF